jgi:hypothetical protein
MKKEEVRLGMEVMHNKLGRGRVVEIKNEKAGMEKSSFVHEVLIKDLTSVEAQRETKPDTRHEIVISYDIATTSLFITIENKETICIKNLSPTVLNDIGISSKSDDDEFNDEIGRALAFYRASM